MTEVLKEDDYNDEFGGPTHQTQSFVNVLIERPLVAENNILCIQEEWRMPEFLQQYP